MGEPQRIGKEREQSVTETAEFVAMLGRQLDAYGRRVAEDPAAIAYYNDLQDRLRDSVNVGLAQAQARKGGWSMRELGKLFGVSHVAIIKRVKAGREIIEARETAAGVVRLGQAARPSVPALREQRAAYLQEVGVPEYLPLGLKGRHRKTA